MYVRLAFAVAAHLEPDILIVDEVLAVGDVQFQKKCLGKMQEVSQSDGRTVLFVSHNLEAVRALCARGLYLADGNLAFTGSSVEAVGQYFKAAKRSFSANKEAKKNEVACFVHCSVIVSDPPVQHRCGKPMRISIGIECFEPVDTLTLSLLVTCPETGASCYIHYTDPSGRLSYNELGRLERGSHFRSCLVESFPGYVGEYRIQATLYCRRQQRTIDQLDGEASFEVVIPHDFAPGAQWPRGLCSFFVPHDWQIESPKSPSNACVETLTY
jgi:lipopolysaccharide transport system ATP-binding protein